MSDLEVEPAAVEPAAEPEAPAEPEWSGVSQEEWEEQQEAIQYLAAQIQPPQSQGQQEPVEAPSLPDWIDDDDRAKLDAYFEQKLAPYADYTQQAILQEAEERAKDILGDIVSRDGEFLIDGSLEKARTLANSLVPQMASQYGYGPAAAEHALEEAAKQVREWEEQVGKAYHERQINQLSNLGGAPREPGAAGTGAQQFVIPEGGSLIDVAYRHGSGTR